MFKEGVDMLELDDQVEPNYGVTGQDFPLWAAREAIAQIAKRLDFQTAALTGYEARATTLLGWLVAAVTAALTAAVPHLIKQDETEPFRLHVGILLGAISVPAFFAAIYLLAVFRPKRWFGTTADIDWLTTDIPDYPSELEIQKAFAITGRQNIIDNDVILEKTYASLTLGRRWFIAMPACAVIASFLLGLAAVVA